MKEIPLTQGYVALVDDVDYDEISAFKWHASVSEDGRVYAQRKNEAMRTVKMHRQLAGEPGLVVDHINGNGLDNRRVNLRAVTLAENSQNITRPVRATTGERNIYPAKGGYTVSCMRFGKKYYGGYFRDLADAINARDVMLASLEPNE